jgi:hypothetical protein
MTRVAVSVVHRVTTRAYPHSYAQLTQSTRAGLGETDCASDAGPELMRFGHGHAKPDEVWQRFAGKLATLV